MRETIIKLETVSKRYAKGRKLLLKEALLDIFKPASKVYFWALKDINISVYRGEALGIIGPNGSGKSTILKLIAGVAYPDRGIVNTNGRIAPLIELGAGLHPELTGRENIFLSGSILGLDRKEIEAKFDSIVDFSGLDDFIDTPIKHYSSGMYMRLGFAIAVHTNPDILLIDEVLSVGDRKFQKKCKQKMSEFKARDVTTVFVSHDLGAIKDFCDRVVYVDGGKLITIGDTNKVLKLYRERSTQKD